MVIKPVFFSQRAQKELAKGQSPLQELEEGLRSGPHLLVSLTAVTKSYTSQDSMVPSHHLKSLYRIDFLYTFRSAALIGISSVEWSWPGPVSQVTNTGLKAPVFSQNT